MTLKDIQDQQIINGTWGEVWVNNELLCTLTKFEAKVNMTYADVTRPRDLWDGKKLLKLDGQGNFAFQKYDSTVLRLFDKRRLDMGLIPDIKIMGKLDDPAALGAERVIFKNVTLNNFTVLAFEHAKEAEEAMDFNFRDYEIYDLIGE